MRENVVDLACRTALSYHAVAHINIPKDIQETGCDERSMRNVKNHTSPILGASARLPGEAELKRAAAVLNAGKRIVILAGQGALHATDDATRGH